MFTAFCEIRAPSPMLADLERITRFCADEIGQSMEVLTREISHGAPLITLHLPAEQAASQHHVWCLACRLACFCPNARASVLVRAETQFAETPALRIGAARRKHATPQRDTAA
jgi:hypothetical protein